MILIPMAGMSSRFYAAGYKQPKFMLPLHGRSLFDWALLSFERYRTDQEFLLVTRNEHDHVAYAEERMRALGFRWFRVIKLDAPTAGQAATVAEGLRRTMLSDANDDLLIFNIDTIRPGFEKPTFATTLDGYVEVANLDGNHWSFVLPSNEPGIAAFLSEKRRISDLCSTGIYHFRKAAHFLEMYDEQASIPCAEGPWKDTGEHYVAPFYNTFIERGERIGYDLVPRESVWFSGTPAEYKELGASDAFVASIVAAGLRKVIA